MLHCTLLEGAKSASHVLMCHALHSIVPEAARSHGYHEAVILHVTAKELGVFHLVWLQQRQTRTV